MIKSKNSGIKNKNELFMVFYMDKNAIVFSNEIPEESRYRIKTYKIEDKKPFYIIKINEKYYYIKKENFLSVKEFIYSNYIFESILISDYIDLLNMNIENNVIYLNNIFQVEKNEFKDVVKIDSIDNFLIFESLKKENNENNEIIKKIESEKEFLDNKLFLKKNFAYLNSFNIINNVDSIYILRKLFLAFDNYKSLEKHIFQEYKANNILNSEYRLPLLKENFFIELTEPLNNQKKYLNLKNIDLIDIIENNYEVIIEDPFNKKYRFIINTVLIDIMIRNKKISFFCFKNDYLKNNILKFNKNKIIKEF